MKLASSFKANKNELPLPFLIPHDDVQGISVHPPNIFPIPFNFYYDYIIVNVEPCSSQFL